MSYTSNTYSANYSYGPSFYFITITNPGGSAPSDGFIDNTKIENYLANAVGADGMNESSLDNFNPPITLANSQAKARANFRYNSMVAQMGFVGNMYISNTTAVGGSATSDPTSFSFNVAVEHGDGSLMTWDELNANTVITTPAAVLARTISRAMIQNSVVNEMILDPTPKTTFGTYGATVSVPRYGERFENLAVGPLFSSLTTANAAVTVVGPLFL